MSDRFEEIRQFIIDEATTLSFDKVGFAKAEAVDLRAEQQLKKWIALQYHGSMGYMENHQDKRLDPRLLVSDCQTVVVFAINHYNELKRNSTVKFAQYALGDDYHDVLKTKMFTLFNKLVEQYPEVSGRVFTDTAPILERYWAQKAGIGWIGKNGNLITKDLGSYVFLCEMLINVPLRVDQEHKEHCKSCTKCIKFCPTNAIVDNGLIDSRKCISYLTIEHRDEFTSEEKTMIGNHLYGCDECQEVCPWNKFSTQNCNIEFQAREQIINKELEQWSNLTVEEYQTTFKKSAVKRAKYSGIIRNIEGCKENYLNKEDRNETNL